MTAPRRLIASLLIATTALTAMPVRGAMLAADVSNTGRERIAAALEREDVQAQLAAHGVSLAQAQSRVAALTDAEAAEMAARLDELPAGGTDLLGVALVVFLVLLLTDILGYTKIFPFTRPARN